MLGRRIFAKGNIFKSLTRSTSTSSVPKSDVPSPSQSNAAPQAPNHPSTWSTNQRPRPTATFSPRFEQTAMELQPNPLSAMEMIANEPVRIVHGRKALIIFHFSHVNLLPSSKCTLCSVSFLSTLEPRLPERLGDGPLGHPKIYINLDKPGPKAYCGIRFEQAPHHH
ncbi:hypothetical protein L218DRAFT_992856 [Marasmius fiardii PR-910]|nr:hypothetical protein L218DRAFT_992856 [Marasmius fiardii PR-910]